MAAQAQFLDIERAVIIWMVPDGGAAVITALLADARLDLDVPPDLASRALGRHASGCPLPLPVMALP